MRYNDFEYTIIHFGKYKGRYLREIPDDYIVWAIKNIDDDALATMFSIEYQRRHKQMRGNNK